MLQNRTPIGSIYRVGGLVEALRVEARGTLAWANLGLALELVELWRVRDNNYHTIVCIVPTPTILVVGRGWCLSASSQD